MFSLKRLRRDAKSLLFSLEGISGREAASALTHQECFVKRSELPLLKEDEIYVIDLIGLSARTEEGRSLGLVENVWEGSGADTLVIRDGNHRHLVPNIALFVPQINLEAGELIVRPIEGLLEKQEERKS